MMIHTIIQLWDGMYVILGMSYLKIITTWNDAILDFSEFHIIRFVLGVEVIAINTNAYFLF